MNQEKVDFLKRIGFVDIHNDEIYFDYEHVFEYEGNNIVVLCSVEDGYATISVFNEVTRKPAWYLEYVEPLASKIKSHVDLLKKELNKNGIKVKIRTAQSIDSLKEKDCFFGSERVTDDILDKYAKEINREFENVNKSVIKVTKISQQLGAIFPNGYTSPAIAYNNCLVIEKASLFFKEVHSLTLLYDGAKRGEPFSSYAFERAMTRMHKAANSIRSTQWSNGIEKN